MNINLLRRLVLQEMFKNGTEPFRPFAAFNKGIGCILVQVRDCSVLEERINMVLTALIDNNAVGDRQENKENIGFLIESARGLCLKYGLPTQANVQLASILNALVSEFPDDPKVVAYVENIARPLLNEFSLDSVIL